MGLRLFPCLASVSSRLKISLRQQQTVKSLGLSVRMDETSEEAAACGLKKFFVIYDVLLKFSCYNLRRTLFCVLKDIRDY